MYYLVLVLVFELYSSTSLKCLYLYLRSEYLYLYLYLYLRHEYLLTYDNPEKSASDRIACFTPDRIFTIIQCSLSTV